MSGGQKSKYRFSQTLLTGLKDMDWMENGRRNFSHPPIWTLLSGIQKIKLLS